MIENNYGVCINCWSLICKFFIYTRALLYSFYCNLGYPFAGFHLFVSTLDILRIYSVSEKNRLIFFCSQIDFKMGNCFDTPVTRGPSSGLSDGVGSDHQGKHNMHPIFVFEIMSNNFQVHGALLLGTRRAIFNFFVFKFPTFFHFSVHACMQMTKSNFFFSCL